MGLAEAEARRIKIVGEAMASEDGKEAVSFQIAEGYVKAYEKMAKDTTTLIVPNNVSDVSSMVSTALSTYSGISKTPGMKNPPADDVIKELEMENSQFTPKF